MATKRICRIDGCDNTAVAMNYCYAHYASAMTTGEPLAALMPQTFDVPVAFLSRVNGKQQVRDFIESLLKNPPEECVAWPFSMNKRSLRGIIMIDDMTRIAPREICRMAHGEPPWGRNHAAHWCGKGHEGCVNPKHLRWATPSENQQDTHNHAAQIDPGYDKKYRARLRAQALAACAKTPKPIPVAHVDSD